MKVDAEECGSSSFDVTTYLPVDRPTHPYKQGLLERNRNNLYPKGLGSDRVSLGYYLLPYVCFAVRMHAHVLVSRDSSIFVPREVYVVPAFEESIDRGCSPRPLRVLPPSLSFPIGHRASSVTRTRTETQNFDSIKYLNRRLELDAYAIRKEGKYFCVNK